METGVVITPVPDVVMKDVGRLLGHAIASKIDFDFWVLQATFVKRFLLCDYCHKQYKKYGWWLRHMRRSGHWKDIQEMDAHGVREMKEGNGYQINYPTPLPTLRAVRLNDSTPMEDPWEGRNH